MSTVSVESTGIGDRPARRKRDPWLDNVKVVATFLVVIGHGLALNSSKDGLALAGFNFLYFFHMPLFVIVSGWLTKKSTLGLEGLLRSAAQLLVPYVIFQFVYAGVFALAGSDYALRTVFPGFGLWYLLSLFCWRLLLPWFTTSRYAMPVAIAVALLAGYTDEIGKAFSFSRTLVLFPAFLLGALYSDQLEVFLRRRRLRAWAVAVVVGAAVVAVITRSDIDRDWLYGHVGYAASDSPQWWAGAWRAVEIFGGLIVALAVASLIPLREFWFTKYGRYTLYGYLLHLVVRQAIRAFDLVPSGMEPRTLTLLIVVGSVLVTPLLMSRPVRMLTRPFVEPAGFIGDLRSRLG